MVIYYTLKNKLSITFRKFIFFNIFSKYLRAVETHCPINILRYYLSYAGLPTIQLKISQSAQIPTKV